MSTDTYSKLREHLHNLPGGFPSTKAGHEINILEKLFSPEEAELAMALRPVLEDVATIAGRLSMSKSEAAEKIENLARKGLIYRVKKGNDTKYMAISFVIGIFEFQLGSIDREFAELYEKYKLHYGMHWISTKTKQMRTIPVNSAIQSKTSVATYDRARDFVKTQETIALADCICRKKNELLDKKCDRPRETCLVFGDIGQFYIDNKLGRQITFNEALKVLDLGEEAALVLCPTNTVEHAAICLCCTCCCGVLSGMKLLPNPADYIDSTYQAAIDPGLCNSCGVCTDRCQMGAINNDNSSYSVNTKRCIGCGLCISSCATNAVSLHVKEGPVVPPLNFDDLLDKISKERGLTKV
jgi:electron transport complex protein RnfB